MKSGLELRVAVTGKVGDCVVRGAPAALRSGVLARNKDSEGSVVLWLRRLAVDGFIG
jgi:hypothetical protein